MKALALSIAIFATLASTTTAQARIYSERDCQAWFKKLDRNNDGSIAGGEDPQGFIAPATLAYGSGRSGGLFLINRSFFVRECKNGIMGMPRL